MADKTNNPTPREAKVATLIRAAARVGRSLATTAGKPTGARAFSGGDQACWAGGRPPARRRPAFGGTGRPAAGGRSSSAPL